MGLVQKTEQSNAQFVRLIHRAIIETIPTGLEKMLFGVRVNQRTKWLKTPPSASQGGCASSNLEIGRLLWRMLFDVKGRGN